ncbi:Gp49 family protein, partial [Arthrospira platensis SPKY2]
EKTMSKDEQVIELEIKEKGLTAKRVTPDMLDAEIAAEDYHVFPGSCLTVCALTLRNGFTVTGESACASPENFNAEIGRKIARSNAREKIWPLLGFRLRDELTA